MTLRAILVFTLVFAGLIGGGVDQPADAQRDVTPPRAPTCVSDQDLDTCTEISGAFIDAMTHPMSQAVTDKLTGGAGVPFSGADDIIDMLNEANVETAVLDSLGFFAFVVTNDSEATAENDFVANEVAKYPERLWGFCGINPLYQGALDEIDRCLALPGMIGIKLNPNFSGMDLEKQGDAEALAAVFDKAAEHDAPVQLHTQTPEDPPMSKAALNNLIGVVEDHPNVRVSHSHCGGVADENTLGRWLTAIRPNRDSAFIDLSTCLQMFEDEPMPVRLRVVQHLRSWGVDHLLPSSDHIRLLDFPTTGDALTTLSKFPFTKDEVDIIVGCEVASAWLGIPCS